MADERQGLARYLPTTENFFSGLSNLAGDIGSGLNKGWSDITGQTAAQQQIARLDQVETAAKEAIANAESLMAQADEDQKALLESFIRTQQADIDRIADARRLLANKIAENQSKIFDEQGGLLKAGFEKQAGALTEQEAALGLGAAARTQALTQQEQALADIAKTRGEGLTQQEQSLAKILQLQQEGIAAREALTADEEAAARRITAPGGLLERQRQAAGLERAKALQKTRVGGPAARAAVMGQFAAQGAQLGAQAQEQIAAAQERARQARAGLLGERSAALVAQQRGLGDIYGRRSDVEAERLRGMSDIYGRRGDVEAERQRGLSDIYGRRGELGMAQQREMANLLGRRGEAETARLTGLYGADIGASEAYRGLGEQMFRTQYDRLGNIAARKGGAVRDVADTTMARLGRESEIEERRRQQQYDAFGNLIGGAARLGTAVYTGGLA